MSDKMRWLPIEPSQADLERMKQWEEFYCQLLTAFALTSEEIGTIQDTNKTYSEQQVALYRKWFGRR